MQSGSSGLKPASAFFARAQRRAAEYEALLSTTAFRMSKRTPASSEEEDFLRRDPKSDDELNGA